MDGYTTALTLDGKRFWIGMPVYAGSKRLAKKQIAEAFPTADVYHVSERRLDPSPIGNCPECGTESAVRPHYEQRGQNDLRRLLGWTLFCRHCNGTQRILMRDGYEQRS